MQLNEQHLMKHDNITIVMHIVWSSMNKTQRFMPTIICNLNSPLISRGIMSTISHPPVQPLNPKEEENNVWHLGLCANPQQPNMQKSIKKAYYDFSTLIFSHSARSHGELNLERYSMWFPNLNMIMSLTYQYSLGYHP